MSANRPVVGCPSCETTAGAMGCQIHNPWRYQVNQTQPQPAGVGTAIAIQGYSDGVQLCSLGHHAWLPWLAVEHPDGSTIRFYWTKCVRCGVQEQYDL